MKANFLIHLVVYLLAWCLGHFLCLFVFDDSPSREAYGLLCGWWMAAYYSYFFRIKIVLVLYLLGLWVGVLLADLFLGIGFFYEGGSEGDPIGYSFMTLLQFAIASSPLLFSFVNAELRSFVLKKFHRAAEERQ